MATKARLEYKPDYAVPPGATLLETIQAKGMPQAELAQRTGRPLKTINEIINGKAAITAETALQLERVLGVPASFWNNLERNYREALAAIKERKALESAEKWAEKFPLKELAKQHLIPDARDKTERLRALLGFFGVSSRAAWEKMWTSAAVAYRRSPAFRTSPWATAAWLRIGELSAQKGKLPAFNKAAFKQALVRLRALTLSGPQELRARLVEECRKCGVAVVFVKELPGTCIHGAVRWAVDAPVVQLSCRYKAEDLFWFTFFHEAGHVLLHGKREVFLEDDEQDGEEEKEKEANSFAGSLLIPDSSWGRFQQAGDFSEPAVCAFATQVRISPGIVVGRMQHEGIIPYSRLNHLKKRFDLTAPAAA
ncbi:MAG: ImmA/IrrE family metallo-endopeptidase [Acidobacteriia bacterium]|nr:ImmA/IrrE family metallo-endopeptidase [Terriglobia bacterium]